MQEITKNNYKSFLSNLEGIIVSIPKKTFKYSSDFYIYGYRMDNDYQEGYSLICYNWEDSLLGFTSFSVEFNKLFNNFDDFKYYKFDNLEEFCIWYLQQRGIDIQIGGSDLKEKYNNKGIYNSEIKLSSSAWQKIKEVDETPLNKKQEKAIEKFVKDVDEFLENPPKTTNNVKDFKKAKARKELNDLNKEQFYWEIYIDDNTKEEQRKEIEKYWPEFKELFNRRKFYILKNNEEKPKIQPWEPLLDIFPQTEEITDIIKPQNQNTKKEQKLNDTITLLKYNKKIQSIQEKMKKLIDEMRIVETEMHTWLDEEI